MRSIDINFGKTKSVYLLTDAQNYIENLREKYNRIFLISDENLFNLYPHIFKPYISKILPAGENFKTLNTIENIFRFFLDNEINKSDIIIGIGGGVISDITGFAASTFKRGIHFGFIPTTLLAMTDASIGGKNGVNFENYKNMLGTITQPKFIVSDISFLNTLPDIELKNGYAEIIKSVAIADSYLLSELFHKQNFDISDIIIKVANIKISIVSEDETEQGIRKVLNFGHTLAHSIEKVYSYPHGMAVALGMLFSSKLSFHYGYLDFNKMQFLHKLIHKFFDLSSYPINLEIILEAIRLDKKRVGNSIDFILLQDFAHPIIKRIPLNNLMENLHAICVTR